MPVLRAWAITLDVDEGVTPFISTCINGDCKGSVYSLCYKVPQEILGTYNHAVEWYKPTQLNGLSRSELEHVSKGGLLSRKVK